ncbi:MAG: ABC transporter substrate-binding protein [Geminicoccaceae bacterium]
MRFRILLILIALAVASPAHAADKLSLLLDWFVNPDHGPIMVAKEKGFFEAVDLDVEIIAPADPNDPPKLVAAGQGDIAISYQPQLHIQVHEGLPLTRIGTLIATPLNALVVLDDSPIQSLADLAGKRIGFSVSGVEEALLTAMLGQHGIGLDDIELINVNFALSPALLAGQVDGVIGAFRNFELNQLDLEGRPGRAFYIEEEGVPAYDELIFVANSKKLDDPRLPRFLDAIEAGTQYLLNHPDESYQLFLKSGEELDNELNARAWKDTLPRFASRPAALDESRYRRFAAFLEEQNLIKDPPAVETYAIEVRRALR